MLAIFLELNLKDCIKVQEKKKKGCCIFVPFLDKREIRQFRDGSRIFFRSGCTRLLLYFNTNKPHSFFLQNTSCIRKPQVISGGRGSAHLLHPPPRSAHAVSRCSRATTAEKCTKRRDARGKLLFFMS